VKGEKTFKVSRILALVLLATQLVSYLIMHEIWPIGFQ